MKGLKIKRSRCLLQKYKYAFPKAHTVHVPAPLCISSLLVLLHPIYVHASCYDVGKTSCLTNCASLARACRISSNAKSTCSPGSSLQEINLSQEGCTYLADCFVNTNIILRCTCGYKCVRSLSLSSGLIDHKLTSSSVRNNKDKRSGVSVVIAGVRFWGRWRSVEMEIRK